MKYIVMETALSYAVVMDEDGRFIKVPNLNYEVGETLDSVYAAQQEPSASFMLGRKLRGWVALAACILAVVLGGTYLWNNPVSFLLIEINPIVRIDSNRFGKVIEVKGMNFDGEQLLEGYKRGSDTAEEVAKEIAALAKQKGYLNDENNQIRISGDENEAAIIAMLKDYFNGEVIVISGKEGWVIPPEPEQEQEEIPKEPDNYEEDPATEQTEKVTLEKAVAIALKNLGIDGAVCTKSEFDPEDNKYEIEFVVGNTEYEYSIDPNSGNILEVKSEPVDEDDDD